MIVTGEDGQVYCQAEYERRFLKQCATCNLVIKEKKPLIAGGKAYHKSCFKCSICKEVLTGRWFDDEGESYGAFADEFARGRAVVCCGERC